MARDKDYEHELESRFDVHLLPTWYLRWVARNYLRVGDQTLAEEIGVTTPA